MTPEEADTARDRLNAEIASLRSKLRVAVKALKALPKGKRGRKPGFKVTGKAGEIAQDNHLATRRVLGLIRRHEIKQRKLDRPIRVPKDTMDDFISVACESFPKAKGERVRTLVNFYRKDTEDKTFPRGIIRRLIVDFDA